MHADSDINEHALALSDYLSLASDAFYRLSEFNDATLSEESIFQQGDAETQAASNEVEKTCNQAEIDRQLLKEANTIFVTTITTLSSAIDCAKVASANVMEVQQQAESEIIVATKLVSDAFEQASLDALLAKTLSDRAYVLEEIANKLNTGC